MLHRRVPGQSTEVLHDIGDTSTHDLSIPDKDDSNSEAHSEVDIALIRATDTKLNAKQQALWNDRIVKATVCKQIISGDAVDCLELAKVLPVDKYASRAHPNQRLVVAFGVNNCFTTSVVDECATFRKTVEGMLNKDSAQWAALATCVEMVVEKEFDTTKDFLSLFDVAQMTSLKPMLNVLFGFDTERSDVDDDIKELAFEINAQWLRSKDAFDPKAKERPAWAFEHQKRPRELLTTVLPEKSADDMGENPLNLLLPGDETMWRVVLRCFVELTARGHDNGSEWCEILKPFAENPTDGHLTQLSGVHTRTSASQIAKETLRLYPPTRRVYRERKLANKEFMTAAADIEECHRDANIWKPDPLRSMPERWNGLEHKNFEDDVFMPFSATPFNCPAKRRRGQNPPFGLAMISLLVGMLVKHTSGKWRVVGDLPGISEPLDTERTAYGYLRLERISESEAGTTVGKRV
ncbi:hypothetical protein LTR56_017571 [Elasticomyces elasticus]|nr:hypothetical protein LTR56_017571 [Elasticomyces elasticus]KAK3631438.1 hypothetical protein LTR22_021078 [Elasticomyces elasticus]KAK4913879.1 hypothetical protein LTR49_017805 [Elasticomyces elasticus]KAK5766340.1 hypothetical protein LTS12_003552 [Elasticomyces elasticus]